MMDFQAAQAKLDEIKQLKSNLVLENTKVCISILLLDTQFSPFQLGKAYSRRQIIISLVQLELLFHDKMMILKC